MFDNYVLKPNSLKNTVVNGQEGFEVKTNITYYRGIPLSMVHDIKVEVDGKEVERENIRFSVNEGQYFTLDEMETVTSVKWNYGHLGTVFIVCDGGLAKGKHSIKLTQVSRVAYIPVPFSGTSTKEMEV